MKKLIEEQYERAKSILRENLDGMKQLANQLIEKEVIFADDVERIFGKRPWKSRSEELSEESESKKTKGNEGEESTTQESPEVVNTMPTDQPTDTEAKDTSEQDSSKTSDA